MLGRVDPGGITPNNRSVPPALAASDAVQPVTRAPDAPDWSLVPFEVGCARCGHDLRGLSEARCPACALEFDWTEAVPIERLVCRKCKYQLLGLSATRCPECGEPFTWAQALDDYHRSRKPIFEYRWRSEPIRSLLRTWWLAFRPWKLWRIIDLHDPPRIGPLIVMVLLAALAMILLRFVPTLTLEFIDHWRTMAYFKQRGVPSFEITNYWWEFVRAIPSLVPRDETNAIAGVWTTLSLGSLLIFQQSMRRCRVRFAHVFRTWVFSVALLAPLFSIATLPVIFLQRGLAPPKFERLLLGAGIPIMFLLVVLLVGIALSVAYRRYLRMPHSVGVVFASQTIAVLASGGIHHTMK